MTMAELEETLAAAQAELSVSAPTTKIHYVESRQSGYTACGTYVSMRVRVADGDWPSVTCLKCQRQNFSTEGIHPRTLAGVTAGSAVIVRDAGGDFRDMIAMGAVTRGHSFLVVWVRGPRSGSDGIPWPATDVWLPGDEPRGAEPPASPPAGEGRQ